MSFRQKVRSAFNQWKAKGYCEEANLLNQKIGKGYFDPSNPHFFTGDINSELILIHLNPKRNKEDWNKPCSFPDFDSYWNFYSNFGKLHYGNKSKRTHKSPFDHKQIRFLKPFNILPIHNDDKYQNLENVVDRKLQVELVPFGSPDFNFNRIGIGNLKPFIENLQSLICEKPRKYVIFCGKVFESILEGSMKSKTIHTFKLRKNDGSRTISDFNVINFTLKTNESEINACIAPQFAKQGYPVTEYGRMVKDLYWERN